MANPFLPRFKTRKKQQQGAATSRGGKHGSVPARPTFETLESRQEDRKQWPKRSSIARMPGGRS